MRRSVTLSRSERRAMADVLCQGCGAPNGPGVKFCTECGTSMAATCPQCGAPATSGRFCGECGSALTAAPNAAVDLSATAAPVTTAPVAPVSERRIVSLLFADLVGFTPLSESRDPEAVRELLSAYFDRAR